MLFIVKDTMIPCAYTISLKTVVIILTIILFLYFLFTDKFFNNFFINPFENGAVTRSNIDFNLYQVRDTEDPTKNTEVANRLAIINKEITRLVKYMKMNNVPDKKTATRLFNRWSDCELRETFTSDKFIALTLNKGESIRLCVRDEDQKLQDYNIGMFVVLHELAHIMSESRDHTEEFKDNFIKILKIATKIGVYKPVDFSKETISYCGTPIKTGSMP